MPKGKSKMPKFLTVVYTIHDEREFRKEKDAINEKFMSSKGKPWAITAMSIDHEINRSGRGIPQHLIN